MVIGWPLAADGGTAGEFPGRPRGPAGPFLSWQAASKSEWLLAVSAVAVAVFGAVYYQRLTVTQKIWDKARRRFLEALDPLALDHPSSAVRRVAQEQLLYWQSDLHGQGFTRTRTASESPPRRDMWPAVREFAVVSALALVAGAGPLILGNLLILTWLDSFHLQYTWLSIGIVCLGSVLLYGLIISEQEPLKSWKGLAEALFPSLADTSSEHEWWSFTSWWPLPLLAVSAASAAVAWIFDIIGWSPTAGFNVGLLAGAIGAFLMLVSNL